MMKKIFISFIFCSYLYSQLHTELTEGWHKIYPETTDEEETVVEKKAQAEINNLKELIASIEETYCIKPAS